MTPDTDSAWEDAEWAAALVVLLGHQLGGVHLKAPPGPVRDYWLSRIESLSEISRLRKIPANISEGRLLGGIDLGATLKQGKPVPETGILGECDGNIVIAAMAERLPRKTVHHLCTALDEGKVLVARDGIESQTIARISVIAADEGIEDETVHPALADRLGIYLNLQHFGIHDVGEERFNVLDIKSGKSKLPTVKLANTHHETLVSLTMSLGIASPRATLSAATVSRGSAALDGRNIVQEKDIARALRLCLLPHAAQIPEIAEPPSETDSQQSEENEPPTPSQQTPAEEERLLESALVQLPDGLLRELQSRAAQIRQASLGKSGAQQKQQQRGRPTGFRKGDLQRGGKINILATLRAATPWQPLRRREKRTDPPRTLEIRPDDIHITRFEQRRDTLTIFVVDASGSAAMQRLAEAKGAVELLLADCYVRRDQVALIAFREDFAELILPPTRSLVRAKKTLAALPGGGATPMAAALQLTGDLGDRAVKSGSTAQYVLLTDGAANVSRDGTRGRGPGMEDALEVAKGLAASGLPGLIIDTAQRPQARARQLAETLAGRYFALPKADAHELNRTIRAAMK